LSAFSKFYFRPGENERVETTVSLQPEVRSAIHGVVKDLSGQPLRDALVMLFEIMPDGTCALTGQMFTDEDGHFVFGPLNDGRLHLVKVNKNTVKLRQLEIVTDSTEAIEE